MFDSDIRKGGFSENELSTSDLWKSGSHVIILMVSFTLLNSIFTLSKLALNHNRHVEVEEHELIQKLELTLNVHSFAAVTLKVSQTLFQKWRQEAAEEAEEEEAVLVNISLLKLNNLNMNSLIDWRFPGIIKCYLFFELFIPFYVNYYLSWLDQVFSHFPFVVNFWKQLNKVCKEPIMCTGRNAPGRTK